MCGGRGVLVVNARGRGSSSARGRRASCRRGSPGGRGTRGRCGGRRATRPLVEGNERPAREPSRPVPRDPRPVPGCHDPSLVATRPWLPRPVPGHDPRARPVPATRPSSLARPVPGCHVGDPTRPVPGCRRRDRSLVAAQTTAGARDRSVGGRPARVAVAQPEPDYRRGEPVTYLRYADVTTKRTCTLDPDPAAADCAPPDPDASRSKLRMARERGVGTCACRT
jgi:hypothetical protein